MPSKIGKWAEEIGFYDKEEKQYNRVLLYGEFGSGKTTLAGTFPHPFFIDTDKGGITLKEKSIPRIKLQWGNKTFDEIMDILHKIKNKEAPFDIEIETVVIDGFTALAFFLEADILLYPKLPGKMRRNPTTCKTERDDYGILGKELRAIVKYLQDMPMHIVATCGVMLEKDEVRGTFIGQPSILGGFRGIVGHEFTEVYYMETKLRGGVTEYVTHFQKSSYFGAKSDLHKTGIQTNASYETLFL
jgi:hypothetical protein